MSTIHPGSFSVGGGRPLTGSVTVPGDKSISHRALLLAALAEGTSSITGLSLGDDVTRTKTAIAAMGATVEGEGSSVEVHGGRDRLAVPQGVIDLGNSGTGMRLIAGLAATLPGTTTLTGDSSLCTRPMDRVALPLARMGASVNGQGERCLPPLSITGGELRGIDYTTPMASAQVKGAVLLAGLDADGETVVRESVATRAHTEEMLDAAGAAISVDDGPDGRIVRLRRSVLKPIDWAIPGDPSQAAFWVVAAIVTPDSRITVRHIHLGPERIGFLHVLNRMGAHVEVTESGPHTGDVTASSASLVGTVIEAAEIPSLDEVPILAIAAMAAHGPTRFRDVGELRVKESDRLTGTAALVASFGGRATIEGDDLVVEGDTPFLPGSLDAHGDHRMAMAAAVAASAGASREPSTITGWDAVATSYPGFDTTLAALSDRSAR